MTSGTMTSSSDVVPWAKNGWEGFATDNRGSVPIGTLILRVRKGDRVIQTQPMTPEQIAKFDPDLYWERERKT